MLTREEETKRRIIAWEEAHGKKLEDLNREEWIKAIAQIMAMTEREAEEYLNYLLNRNSFK
jgi:gluconate kinase